MRDLTAWLEDDSRKSYARRSNADSKLAKAAEFGLLGEGASTLLYQRATDGRWIPVVFLRIGSAVMPLRPLTDLGISIWA